MPGAADQLEVGVDVTPIIAGATGVSRYSRELLMALQARGVATRCFAIGRGREPAPAGTRVVRVPLRLVHQAWRLTGRPRVDRLVGNVQVVHSMDMVPPPTRRPIVATVYDLGAITHPSLYPPRSNEIAQRQLDAARRADVVLTDSAAVRADLATFGFDTSRVVVAHGAPVRLPPPGPLPVGDAPFLLAVGTLAASKGPRVLLAAFARAALDDVRLVFAGPVGYGGDGLAELAAELGVADRVTFLGRVTDATLAALYEHALAFVCASLVEGFGLPALEAMRAGLPVVASRLPALEEVAGTAALWVTPGDVSSLAEGLQRIADHAEVRDRLRTVGRAPRPAEFSWERTADATIVAYRQAIER